ncbi:winged helix-turn-helix domain-containing protein [Amycolatopsis acidiphila]|uniref:Winged helix-turn-helix transcriptional regulator n=1 Tax=Amycolatopsis acidiphila TaxID=715473 RepID=A0A557ZYR4_9PSEU|nr:winged helix-turn-helix domain-containing protein [Amycolatopsis acidiphila]TVT17131.1 winged helix-turn-helix transcriptional regulator [Amycolatopsis acidiphila]UIJ58322.1 winged helix-turn-helix domain-containing protein [Amycolatopsis acidiphila]
MPHTRREATEAEANALASGIRLRIIRLTYADALTNKELAERLGRDPATVLHHVRKLVDTGFLAPQPARRGNRGAKEIPYLSTGLSWYLDEVGLHEQVGQAMLEAYLGEIAEVPSAELRQTRLVVQVSPADRTEFEDRLHALLEEFKARSETGGGDRTAIYIATYPSR